MSRCHSRDQHHVAPHHPEASVRNGKSSAAAGVLGLLKCRRCTCRLGMEHALPAVLYPLRTPQTLSTSTSCYTSSNADTSPAVNLYHPNIPSFYPLKPFSLVQERAATSPKHAIHLPPSPSPPSTTTSKPLFTYIHTHRRRARPILSAQLETGQRIGFVEPVISHRHGPRSCIHPIQGIISLFSSPTRDVRLLKRFFLFDLNYGRFWELGRS